MKNYKIIVHSLIVILCGLALGVGLVERWNILNFAKEQSISYFASNNLVIFIISLFSILLLWWFFSLLISRISGAPYLEVLYYDSYSLLPLLLMYVSSGQKSFFLGLRFFYENNSLLLMFCAIGVIYLKIRYIKLIFRRYPSTSLDKGIIRLKSLFFRFFFEGKRWKLNLFLLTFILYLLLTSLLFIQIGFPTGDEPHYLLLTYSMLEDRDLDLSNNYANRDYSEFFAGDMRVHAHRGKASPDILYSSHTPAFSLWLLPFYYLGQGLGIRWLIFFVRGSICLITALLSVHLVDLAKEIFNDRRIALLGWLAASFTSPLVFYSRHLYPEVPAALVSLLVVKAIRKVETLNLQKMLLVGLGIGFLPWLGQKFFALSATLILATLVIIWKKKALFSSKILFILPILLLICLFFLYIYALYGNFSPYSTVTGYLGPQARAEVKEQIFWNWQLKPKITSLMSYFLDQKEGLLIYSPIYLFSFLGFYALFRISKKDFWLLLVVLCAHVGIYAYMHETSGFCPPTRPLVAIIWILAIFLCASFKLEANKWIKSLRRSLIIASLIIALLLHIYPDTLYQNIVKNTMIPSKLYFMLSNIYLNFTKVLPSLMELDILSYKTIIFWFVAFSLIILFLFFLSFKKEKSEQNYKGPKYIISIIITMVMVTIGALLFCLFPRFHLDRLSYMEFFSIKPYRIYSLWSNFHGPELGGFWVMGRKEARLILQTPFRTKQLDIKLRSPISQTINIGIADYCWSKEIDIKGKTALKLSLPRAFFFKGSWLYLINIESESGFYPYRVDGSQDNRFLGVFAKITPIYIQKRTWETEETNLK